MDKRDMVISMLDLVPEEDAQQFLDTVGIPDFLADWPDDRSREIRDGLSARDQIKFTLEFTKLAELVLLATHDEDMLYALQASIPETEAVAMSLIRSGEAPERDDYHNSLCPNCHARHLCWPDVWSVGPLTYLIRKVILDA